MKDLRTRLQEGDPVAREGGLSRDDRDRMLCHILTATSEPASASQRTLLVLATALVLVTVGSALRTHRFVSRTADGGEVATVTHPSGPSTVRQLQFSTPSGTRLIWIFNPNLSLR